MIGLRFGRLVVTAPAGRTKHGKPTWLCRCDCGSDHVVVGANLRSGNSQSCGCLQREEAGARALTHGHAAGVGVSPTYQTWTGMIQRCTNPERKHWERYGGRGISVCTEWAASFESFLADMGERPEGTSIDRIDGNGNYEPGNCRWATPAEQEANKARRPDFDTHCVNGHPWTTENTRINAAGTRFCRPCDRARKPRAAFGKHCAGAVGPVLPAQATGLELVRP